MPVEIPDDPNAFFTDFFKQQYAVSPRFPRADTAGQATFEVFDAGAWSFRVKDCTLHVEAGVSASTVIQVGVSRGDFDGLFIERTRRALTQSGRIPDELFDVFMPLFVDERKRRIAASSHGSIRIDLEEAGRVYRIMLTTGRDRPTEPRTVVGMRLEDFLGLVSGNNRIPGLLLRGRLRIRGEKAHALKLSGLLQK